MKLHWTLLLFALAGCGKVQALADASLDSKLPDALTCSGVQTLCGNACADLQSSMTSCGACGISCQADRETCMAGHCVDFNTSCAAIKAGNPSAASGPYTLLNNTTVFCDMEHSMTYTQLMFGQYNATHAGYDMVSLADLQDPTLQKAFIYLFNRQGGGAQSLGAFTSPNCCFKARSGVNMTLEFGANYMYPATPNSTTSQCNQSGGYTLGSYGFLMEPSGVFTTATLASDFFTSHPATEVQLCTDGTNPAFFWKRTASM